MTFDPYIYYESSQSKTHYNRGLSYPTRKRPVRPRVGMAAISEAGGHLQGTQSLIQVQSDTFVYAN